MQDLPDAAVLIRAAADHFRQTGPGAGEAFRRRVAINALDLAARELTLAPDFARVERERLRALLGEDGTVEALNERLCARIQARDTGTLKGLVDHLWRTTIEKLLVDQPTYSALRATLAATEPEGQLDR